MDGEVSIINPLPVWKTAYLSGDAQVTAYPATTPSHKTSTVDLDAFSNTNGVPCPRHAGAVRVWVDLVANVGQSPTVMLDFFGYNQDRVSTRRWGWLARLDASHVGGASNAAIVVDTTRYSPGANSIVIVDGSFLFGGDFERILVRPTILTGTITLSASIVGLNVYLGFPSGI